MWLGWRDSNPLYRSQSPVCYHYTTSQNLRCILKIRAGPMSGPYYIMGWVKGLEPSTPGTTIRCSNQLSYTHHRENGTPEGTRTPGLLLRRQLLYPAELLAHINGALQNIRRISATALQTGAGEGNRTLVSSLEGWCSTIELHPQALK